MTTTAADAGQPAQLEAALSSARLFMAQTASAIHPGLSPRTLLGYLADYRRHLAAVISVADGTSENPANSLQGQS